MKTFVLLQGYVRTLGNLIEQTSVTVFCSHHYLSCCLYCCEDLCTIAKGRETGWCLIEQISVTVNCGIITSVHAYIVLPTCVLLQRDVKTTWNSDCVNRCNSILVPSLPQILPILLSRSVNYCKGTWNRADVWFSKLQSQCSGPIINSVPAYIFGRTCLLLQEDE